MKTNMLRYVVITLLLTTAAGQGFAQVSLGADILSRYVWRGVEFGDSPSFQPSLSFTTGSFAFGTWGAYSFSGNPSVFTEHDIWASYAIATSPGTFSFIATDYYYPSAGGKFFDFDGASGSHTVELGLGFSAEGSFPVVVKGFVNVHNDPDNSVYIEVGYPFAVDGVDITAFAGGTAGRSGWYVAGGPALINVGLSAKKSLVISESFSLPVFATYIVNPELEQSYLTFGISF